MTTTTFKENVQQRAYEIYLKRGGKHGNDQEDWFLAEKEVRGQNGTSKESKRHNGRS